MKIIKLTDQELKVLISELTNSEFSHRLTDKTGICSWINFWDWKNNKKSIEKAHKIANELNKYNREKGIIIKKLLNKIK